MGTKMEETVVVLPMLEDSVVALGDLWDCRTLSAPGNIFGTPLQKEHLEAHPMKDLTYTLRNIKNTKDAMDSLKVNASITVEISQGTIKGSAEYSNVENSKYHQELLNCSYKLNTYVVRVRPNAVDIVDPIMKSKIVDGKITILN